MINYLNTVFDLNSSEQVKLFDELPLWSAPFGLKLFDHIKFRKKITVLDIGFGTGFPLTELAMRLGNSCRVYGIDPWEVAVKRAEEKINFYNIKNVEIIQGAAENIPLENDSIDLITSNNGINNVTDINKVLEECSRIIKNKGQFLQTMNLNSSMAEFYDIMKEVLKSFNMNTEINKMQEHIYQKRKPLNEFTSLLEKYNFKVKNIEQDSFEYRFADGTTMLNHYFIRLAFLDSWKKIIPAKKHVEIFSIIENKMNEKAVIEGYFRLSIPFAVIDCERN